MSGPMKPGVVFDCVVCLQGAAREAGPAGACVRLMRDGHVTVYVSRSTLAEVSEVLNRSKSRQRFKTLTPERVEAFLQALQSAAVLVDLVPQTFTCPRDPDDEPYVNLALAAGASYLVSWDNDLLDLMEENPGGVAFRGRFPGLRILTPVAFLRELASPPAAPAEGQGQAGTSSD
jgi:putative PIN family toxin of toxin-antitoxin system